MLDACSVGVLPKQACTLPSACFLDLPVFLIFDCHLLTEMAPSCTIHARPSKLGKCLIFTDIRSRHRDFKEYWRPNMPYVKKQPHWCGQNGRLHPLPAAFSLFCYYLNCHGFSEGIKGPSSSTSPSSVSLSSK